MVFKFGKKEEDMKDIGKMIKGININIFKYFI